MTKELNRDLNRELGKSILDTYLSVKSNVEILEKRIFMSSTTPEEYLQKLYECIGYITEGWVKEYHEDIKEKKTGFELSVYSEYLQEIEETDEFLSNDLSVEEGALQCPKCKSQKTFSYTKQVRSADEGTSVFAQCYNCSNKWRES